MRTRRTPIDEASVRKCARMWSIAPRHARVAACLLLAMSDKEVADATGLTLATVRTYVKQIYKAAGVHSRAALLRASMLTRGKKP